jgi:hypothetical protein
MSSMIGGSAALLGQRILREAGPRVVAALEDALLLLERAQPGDSVRGLIPASERSSSQKREQPSARSRTSSSVHLPHTISAVMQTGHVSSTAISTFTLPPEVTAPRRRRSAHGEAHLRVAPDPRWRSPAQAAVSEVAVLALSSTWATSSMVVPRGRRPASAAKS